VQNAQSELEEIRDAQQDAEAQLGRIKWVTGWDLGTWLGLLNVRLLC
jgi:hypothetical protein